MREHAGEHDLSALVELAHDVLSDAEPSRGAVYTYDDPHPPGSGCRAALRGPPVTFEIELDGPVDLHTRDTPRALG